MKTLAWLVIAVWTVVLVATVAALMRMPEPAWGSVVSIDTGGHLTD